MIKIRSLSISTVLVSRSLRERAAPPSAGPTGARLKRQRRVSTPGLPQTSSPSPRPLAERGEGGRGILFLLRRRYSLPARRGALQRSACCERGRFLGLVS